MDIGLKKVRQTIATLSLAALLMSMMLTGVTQAAFGGYSDVPADAWFHTYVMELADQGILDTTKTTYRPGDEVTRAEMAKLAVEAAGLTHDTSAGPSFSDVASSAWSYDYIETAAKNGIVSGYGNGKFGPNDAVTREQAAKILANAMSLAEHTEGGPHFSDVTSDMWSYKFVETMYHWSVIDGYADGTFGPGKHINRAEVAKMVVNSMNPVVRGNTSGAFNVQTATATSATTVDVMFSMDLDPVTAATAANYMVKDASGAVLTVSAATVSGDKVTLTTSGQTENKGYTLTVTGVKSADGKMVDQATADFNGFSMLGTGGPLEVSLATTSPASASVPKGATAVTFGCFNFKATGDAAVVQGLTVHRFGAGTQTDFSNVYVYNDAMRVTTGRSINSETQTAEFSNINQVVAAGATAKICVVADIASGASGASQHGFELVAASAVSTNATTVTGSFPLKSNVMTIAGGSVGTVTVTNNGSLDQITVGQTAARIAQFQLETNGSEDQELQRIALYIRGAIRTTDLSNLKLYAEGGAEVLASSTGIGSNNLATFVLAKPYVISRGQRRIFHVDADVKGRNGDDIKVYIDEPTDVLMVGKTFGFGAQVTISGNGGYDGAAGKFSTTTVKGSNFTVAFNGPKASDIAVGQKAAHCLDLTITNTSGSAVEIKDWKATVAVVAPTTPTTGGGLFNTAGFTSPNFTLVKLARVNADGTTGGSLLGPVEITSDADVTDSTATVTLAGSATVNAGESIKAAVVMDVSSSDTGTNDKVKCTLLDLTGISDSVRDVNGDALTSSSITPASNIAGNQMTISSAALTFDVAGSPSSRTYISGTQKVDLLGLSVRAGSALDNTIKSLTLQGYVNGTTADTPFDSDGVSANDGGANLKDIVSNLGLYDQTGKLVSDLKNVGSTDGKVVFNNLTIKIPKSQTMTLLLKGDINNSAPYGALSDRVKFALAATTDVTVIDGTGQTVSSDTAITNNATNSTTADAGTRMTISTGGTGTAAKVSSSNAAVVTGGVDTQMELTRVKFSSTNESPLLQDLQFGVLDNSSSTINRIYLYTGSTCSTAVGSTEGYAADGNGIFTTTDIGVTIPDSSSVTLCVKGAVNPVGANNSAPADGSNVGVVLMNVTEVASGNGGNISKSYVSTALDDVTAEDLDAVETVITFTGAPSFAAGAVIVIDQEMMLVTGVAGNDATVVRGFAGTTAVAHTTGASTGLSTIAVDSTTDLNEAVDNAETAIDVASGAAVSVGDVIGWTNTAETSVEYALVTAVNTNTLTVVRGIWGSTKLVNDGADGNDEVFKFTLHGALNRLRRSAPTITLNSMSGPFNLPAGTVPVLSMHVTANGQDDVNFNAGGDQIVVSFTGKVAGADLADGSVSCDLKDTANNVYDTAIALDADAVDPLPANVVKFAFATKNLVIDKGTSKDLYVQCNLAGFIASGDSLQASLPSLATTVKWSDGVTSNIDTDGTLIVPSALLGPTFTNN